MAFWIPLLINVGLAAVQAGIQALSRSKVKAQPYNKPEVNVGDPVPVFWGIVKVPLRPIVWQGYTTEDINEGPRPLFNLVGARATKGKRYKVMMTTLIGAGPVHRVYDILVDNKSISGIPLQFIVTGISSSYIPTIGSVEPIQGLLDTWAGPTAAFVGKKKLILTAPNLLGGTDGNGGVSGAVFYSAGKGFAGTDEVYFSGDPDDTEVPEWRHYAYMVWNNVWLGNSPVLPALHAVVGREPQAPLPWGVVGSSGVFADPTVSDAQGDANPGSIIWELLTHPYHGLGLPDHVLDFDSFYYFNDQMKGAAQPESAFGLSFVMEERASALDVIKDILRTCDGSLYTDPSTGKIGVQLHRAASLTPGIIPAPMTIDPSIARSVKWTMPVAAAEINTVRVTFTDRTKNYRKETVSAENSGLVAAMGGPVVQDVEFLGITSEGMARRLAVRELRALTVPLGRATIKCDRVPAQLWPGRHVKLTWPELGLTERMLRVLDIDFGTPDDPTVTIEAIDDVYAMGTLRGELKVTTPNWNPKFQPPGGWYTPEVDIIPTTLTGATGSVAISLVDPEERVNKIEYRRIIAGSSSAGDWIEIEGTPPFSFNVALHRDREVIIETRIRYLDVNGAVQYITQQTVLPKGVFPQPPRIVIDKLDFGDGDFKWVARMYATDSVTTRIYAIMTDMVWDSGEQVRDAVVPFHDPPGAFHAGVPFYTIFDEFTVVDSVRKTTQTVALSQMWHEGNPAAFGVAAVAEDSEGNLSYPIFVNALTGATVIGEDEETVSSARASALEFVFDAGEVDIAVGKRVRGGVPWNYEIVGWTVLPKETDGSIAFTVLRNGYGATQDPVSPGDAIHTDNTPAVIDAGRAHSESLEGWDVFGIEKDVLVAEVSMCDGVTACTLVLWVRKETPSP